MSFLDVPGVKPAGLDAATAALLSNPASATAGAGNATYATSGQVRSKAKADGTDQTAVLQAEINALTTGAGGTLILPSSSFGAVPIKVTTLTLANDGTTPAKQAPLIIQGQGAHWSGRGTAIIGGTILEFTGTDTYGLLKTNGLGLLKITGVTFSYKGTGTTPFIYTTNTTLNVCGNAFVGAYAGPACIQDAIVCGGTVNIEGGQGWTDGFQGYGTIIEKNFFSGIRRAVYGRTFFNANVIRDNTVWTTCGFTTGAAFELDGDAAGTAAASNVVGNVIRDNLIELTNYKWGIRLGQSAANTIANNNMFDKSGTTAAGVRLATNANNNHVTEGYSAGLALAVDDQSGTNLVTATSPAVYSVAPPTKFSDLNYDTIISRFLMDGPYSLNIQPKAARSDGVAAFSIKRSAAEATNAGASVYEIRQDGSVVYGSTATAAGNVTGPYSKFTGGGRTWSGVGALAGQEGGSNMTQDSGPGGSYFDHKNYAARFFDHNGGPLRMRIGAGKDGFDLGAANDATVQRAAAGIINVGKLAVTNSAAATTPGAVSKKVEIFDAAGASLGFIAVYSSIT